MRPRVHLHTLLERRVGGAARRLPAHVHEVKSEPELDSGATIESWHGATVEDGSSVDVEPLGGRLVIFDSRRILHAVRPAHGEERWALTVWV